MCVGVAGDAEQGGSAAAERRSVDGALCEGLRSAGGGGSTQLYITVLGYISRLKEHFLPSKQVITPCYVKFLVN